MSESVDIREVKKIVKQIFDWLETKINSYVESGETYVGTYKGHVDVMIAKGDVTNADITVLIGDIAKETLDKDVGEQGWTKTVRITPRTPYAVLIYEKDSLLDGYYKELIIVTAE